MSKIKSLQIEVKTLKAIIEAINPSLDNLKQKIAPLKSEFKQAGFSMANLLKQTHSLQANIGKSIGHGLLGNKHATASAMRAVGNNFQSLLPKLLMSYFAGSRANGGAVNTGNSYLVGENGPEIFMPNQAGKIMPKASNNINLTMNITTNNMDSFRKSQNQLMAEMAQMLKKSQSNW